MSGLGHFFEDEGIATVSISLVREHTEVIRPPRALWVPFELGRPFGAPNEPAFQREVVRAALGLLESDDGPVLLADFPQDAPGAAEADGSGWVCPVTLAPPPGPEETELAVALVNEIGQLTPWYAVALETRGRTTFGASGLTIEDAARFVAAFVDGAPENPRPDLPVAQVLKLAFEDLRAWYTEAATARPGAASSAAVRDWFWGETTAGASLLRLHQALTKSEDKALKTFANGFLVPRTQQHRLE